MEGRAAAPGAQLRARPDHAGIPSGPPRRRRLDAGVAAGARCRSAPSRRCRCSTPISWSPPGASCCPICAIPRCGACRSTCPAPASTWWKRCTTGGAPTPWSSSRTSASSPRPRRARCCSSRRIATAATRAPSCEARVLSRGATVATGRTSADGVLESPCPTRRPQRGRPRVQRDAGRRVGQPARRRAVRRARRHRRPGRMGVPAAGPRAGRVHLHRQADLPARPHRAREGGAALAAARRAGRLRPPRRRGGRHRPDRYGDQPAARPDRRVRHHGDRPGARRRRRPRRLRHHRVERRRAGQRRLRGPGVPPARVRGHRHDRRSLRRAGQRGGRRRAGPLLLRPAGGQRPRALRRDRQPYWSPFRFSDDADPDDRRRLLRRRRARRRRSSRWAPTGAAQIRLPLDVDENGRDYRARIEARVADGSGREVTGAGLVQATYGSFLVATRLDQVHGPARRHRDALRRARSTTPARPAPTCRSGCWSNASTTADGYYSAPTVTRVSDTRRQHRCRGPALGTDPRAGAAGQLPRRRRRPRGPARPPRRRLAVGAGPVRDAGHDRATSTSNCWPTSAATPRATPRGSWSAAATSSGRCC